MREIIRGILIVIGCLLILNGIAGYYESKRVNEEQVIAYKESKLEQAKEEECINLLRVDEEESKEDRESKKDTVGKQNKEDKENGQEILERELQVVGILKIPSINIEYPIMQGEDNEYYLTHDSEGRESVYGSIFWDYKNRPLIFGHNMRDGSMFGKLKEIKLEDIVYIDERSYKVIKKEVLNPYKVMEVSTLALVTCQGDDRLVVYLE